MVPGHGLQSTSPITLFLLLTKGIIAAFELSIDVLGSYSLSVINQQFQALYLHAPSPFLISSYANLTFLVNGGSSTHDPVGKLGLKRVNTTYSFIFSF